MIESLTSPNYHRVSWFSFRKTDTWKMESVRILRTLSGKAGTCGKDDAREYSAEPTPTNGCVGQRPEAQWKAGVPVGSQLAEGRPRAAAIVIFKGR
jgi:hypothetical protein